MTTNILWIRRDLRLHDNPALHKALEDGSQVVPVFILDPILHESHYVAPRRLAFLYAALESFDNALRKCGSQLFVRTGKPSEVLKELMKETKAAKIIAARDFSPYAQKRDQALDSSIHVEWTAGSTIFPPEVVRKNDGGPYTVFTPFSRRWKGLPALSLPSLLSAPDPIPTPAGISPGSLPIMRKDGLLLQYPASEVEALKRLEFFLHDEEHGIYQYAEARNRIDLKGTSNLSPYLRFGMLSPRLAYAHGREAAQHAPNPQSKESADAWLNQLLWREFFTSILFHFPHVRQESFRPVYRNLPWENDDTAFEAWCSGQTGYPIVDACMRQLQATGWMHNRGRMIVASFLVKDLLIDWRWGERWFMQQLVDGDPANNNGGWQWAAGTGTDAAPYFRIFNPVLQSKKHDPHGSHIRAWIPELKDVPDKYIHAPWEMPTDVQNTSSCIISKDYPNPIIDHKWARERTLRTYANARDAAGK